MSAILDVPCLELLEPLGLPALDLLFDPGFLPPEEGMALFEELRATTPWRQEHLELYERIVPIPRLIAWVGDPRHAETYSRIPLVPHPWTESLRDLKDRVERRTGERFNAVLLSLYRDGRDSVAWHRDYRAIGGSRALVASVSLGATRRFLMKHQTRRDLPTLRFSLESGSLLLMRGATQEQWLHHVPKTKQPVGERISLTFRRIRD